MYINLLKSFNKIVFKLEECYKNYEKCLRKKCVCFVVTVFFFIIINKIHTVCNW